MPFFDKGRIYLKQAAIFFQSLHDYKKSINKLSLSQVEKNGGNNKKEVNIFDFKNIRYLKEPS
jgi:hypothetical protein